MAPPIPDFSEVFGPSQDDLPGLVEGNPALFGIPLVLLDGGMGTTLEDDFSQTITDSPLWSASLIQNNPALLGRLHEAFLRAGSRVISTSTYQASFETYERVGCSEADAVALMRESVKIADDVRQRLDRGGVNGTASATTATFDTPSTSSVRQRPDHKVCLSLGPYGAMLPYAQEFDAIYPPPFGPCSFDPDTETVQTNSFILPPPPSSEKDTISTAPSSVIPPEELASHSALTEFHLSRLRVFAQDERTWSRIDLVAFETTPLMREAKAIREAVARLQSEMHDRSGVSWAMKPWYISFVFPGGRFPEERWVGGPKYDVRTIVETVFLGEGETSSASSAWAIPTSMPSGIGINCTEPKYLPKLIKEMSETLRSRAAKRSAASLPWLVVYPNGGTQYDIIHRTWVDRSSSPADKWAEEVLKAVETGITAGTSGGPFSTKGEENVVSSEDTGLFTPWGGFLIGGCCKASPAHIAALERRLHPAKGTPLRDREEEGTAQR